MRFDRHMCICVICMNKGICIRYSIWTIWTDMSDHILDTLLLELTIRRPATHPPRWSAIYVHALICSHSRTNHKSRAALRAWTCVRSVHMRGTSAYTPRECFIGALIRMWRNGKGGLHATRRRDTRKLLVNNIAYFPASTCQGVRGASQCTRHFRLDYALQSPDDKLLLQNHKWRRALYAILVPTYVYIYVYMSRKYKRPWLMMVLCVRALACSLLAFLASDRTHARTGL